MKKRSKCPSLAQEISFGSAQLHKIAVAGKRYSNPAENSIINMI
jgi:hypothetical protein